MPVRSRRGRLNKAEKSAVNYLPQNIYQKTNNNKIEVCVPGSKSITARALLISAIANGESTLTGVQYSDDCQTFLDCIVKLGIGVTREGDGLKIRGCKNKRRQRRHGGKVFACVFGVSTG